MEWYSRSDVDELIVPKDQEALDWAPSPDDWSDWGIIAFESSVSPKKESIVDTNSTGEEFNFNRKSFRNEVYINNIGNERKDSSHSSIHQGAQHGSLQWTPSSFLQPDYEIGVLSEIDQIDNIFLRSFPGENLTGTDYFHRSFSHSPEYQDSMMPNDGYLTDMEFDLQDIPGHMCDNGNLNCVKTDAFTPAMHWKNGELSTSCPPVKAPVAMICISAEQDGLDDKDGVEASLEEYVLHELQQVTSQLTQKTRNCFRDALYRLANNSKQLVLKQSQNGDVILDSCTLLMVHKERSRLGETEPAEAKTNAIDRAIANLMFNKMDFDMQNASAAASSKTHRKL